MTTDKKTWYPVTHHDWQIIQGQGTKEIIISVPKYFTKEYITEQNLHEHTRTKDSWPYTAIRPELVHVEHEDMNSYLLCLLKQFVTLIENNKSTWQFQYPEYV